MQEPAEKLPLQSHDVTAMILGFIAQHSLNTMHVAILIITIYTQAVHTLVAMLLVAFEQVTYNSFAVKLS